MEAEGVGAASCHGTACAPLHPPPLCLGGAQNEAGGLRFLTCLQS